MFCLYLTGAADEPDVCGYDAVHGTRWPSRRWFHRIRTQVLRERVQHGRLTRRHALR